MKYKGYKIMATARSDKFYPINREGDITGPAEPVDYFQSEDDSEIWYAVVDKDNYCAMSFETITECKEYINEIKE